MDLAGKILSDTPFKEVNLLNELEHMEHSCGQTDAAPSMAVPCLCQERVPNAGPLLLGALHTRRQGDTECQCCCHCRGRALARERKQNKNFAGSLENLARSGRCFVVLFLLPCYISLRCFFCRVELSKCSIPDTSSTLKFFCNYQDDVH